MDNRKPRVLVSIFFFNDTATTEIYTLSLHDALPISRRKRPTPTSAASCSTLARSRSRRPYGIWQGALQLAAEVRSEEHTSELQSRPHLVCRLLLENEKWARASRSPE